MIGLYRTRRSRYDGGPYGSSSRCARPTSVGTPVVARRPGSDPVPTHLVRNRTDEQVEINRFATKRHKNRTEAKGIQRTRPDSPCRLRVRCRSTGLQDVSAVVYHRLRGTGCCQALGRRAIGLAEKGGGVVRFNDWCRSAGLRPSAIMDFVSSRVNPTKLTTGIKATAAVIPGHYASKQQIARASRAPR